MKETDQEGKVSMLRSEKDRESVAAGRAPESERAGPRGVRRIVPWRWVLIVALLPLVVLGLLALSMKVFGLVRYDPAYFTEPFLREYETPGAAARALETALQTNDQALLAELQGLRWPARFETAPSMIFIMLWEHTDRYVTYLYFDIKTYERHPHYFEQVKGRWVASPDDLYYYMNSGRWQVVFLPIAIVWWLAGGLAIGLVILFRISERFRARLYGG